MCIRTSAETVGDQGDLEDEQVAAPFAEAGVEPEQMIAVGGWKKTSQHVAIAFIPCPRPSC